MSRPVKISARSTTCKQSVSHALNGHAGETPSSTHLERSFRLEDLGESLASLHTKTVSTKMNLFNPLYLLQLGEVRLEVGSRVRLEVLPQDGEDLRRWSGGRCGHGGMTSRGIGMGIDPTSDDQKDIEMSRARTAVL